MAVLSRDVRISHVMHQTWQFSKYKKQPGSRVLNGKPKSFHWWKVGGLAVKIDTKNLEIGRMV
jgi:hypothetical protein